MSGQPKTNRASELTLSHPIWLMEAFSALYHLFLHMWLFWLIFLISKAKLTTGSLFLLKLIKLRREQDVNLDQIGVKSNFRFNSKEHDGSFLGKSFKTFFTANTPAMKWPAYHNQI